MMMSIIFLIFWIHVCTGAEQIWNCETMLDAWRPAPIFYTSNNNDTVVRYNKPVAAEDYFGIGSLKFYLMRSDTNFSCKMHLKQRNRFVYSMQTVTRDNFCEEFDYCEVSFTNLTYGYYCIQVSPQLLNDGIRCPLLYLDHTVKVDSAHASDAYLAVTSARDLVSTSSAITWTVVGSMVFVGLFLAFALDRVHTRRRQQYSGVAVSSVSNNKQLIDMETFSVTAGPPTDLHLARELTGRLLVLYAFNSRTHFQLVKHLVDLLRHTLPNWEIILDRERMNDICVKGAFRWVLDILRKADRIVVIGSEQAYRQTHMRQNENLGGDQGDFNCVFLFAWNCIVNDPNLRGNYAKVFNVRFECTNPKYLLQGVVPGRHFLLPAHYLQLINHILGSSSIADAFCENLKGKLKNLVSHELLSTAVDQTLNHTASHS